MSAASSNAVFTEFPLARLLKTRGTKEHVFVTGIFQGKPTEVSAPCVDVSVEEKVEENEGVSAKVVNEQCPRIKRIENKKRMVFLFIFNLPFNFRCLILSIQHQFLKVKCERKQAVVLVFGLCFSGKSVYW